MRVLALGPVEVRSEGGRISLGGQKPKALLAALLQQPRQVVSIERLIALVWEEVPPQSATALVHNYVSLLRRGFASLSRQDVLATRAPGYLLNLTAQESDLEVFEQDLDLARQAERGHEFDEAARLYESALGLWRGPAFGGVDARFAREHAAGLEEDRLGAEEGFARCMLTAGRAEEVASRLSRLVSAHPLREESRALLMRALYENGRQTDALAVYREGRAQLLDELGIEPGEKLRNLQSQILSGRLEPTERPVPVPAQNRAGSAASVVREAPVKVAIAAERPAHEHVVPQGL